MPNNVTIAKLQDKSVNITSSGTTTIYPDTGYTAMHSVSVDVNVASPSQINFIDFDGTIVVSYTGQEVQALSALPSSPDHSTDEVPLTFDEWNWTLSEIKAYNSDYPETVIWVGANYHTTDGKIHLLYRIATDEDTFGVKFKAKASGTVDWGDGSSVESFSSGDITHVYTNAGRYHCVIDSGSTESINCGYYASKARANVTWSSKVERVCLPSSITTIADMAFWYCSGLSSITIPSSITTIGGNAFAYCHSLKSLSIPDSVTAISDTVRYNQGFKTMAIPPSLTRIGDNTFGNCYTLKSITIPPNISIIGYSAITSDFMQSVIIPSSITKIDNNAFVSCCSLYSVTILATTPPTLGSNAFSTTYIQKIYVPYSADHSVLNEYKSASNWSNFASIMEELPAS